MLAVLGHALLLLPLAAEPSTRTLTDEAQRAREACTFDGAAWRCAPAVLARFSVKETTALSGDSPALVEVTAVEDATCVRGVEIALKGVSGPLQVDWRAISILHDGAPVDAAPGIDPSLHVKPPARAVTSPATRALRQRFFPSTEGACLAPAAADIAGARDVLEVVVPHAVGGVARTARWRSERAWSSVDERTAFALIPEPARAGPPRGAPPLVAAPLLVAFFTVWGPVACLAPMLGFIVAGVGIDKWNTSTTQGRLWLFLGATAACVGFVCGPAGLLAAIAGVVVDAQYGLGWLGTRAGSRDEAAAHEAHRAAMKRRHDAWVEKREALGLASTGHESLD